MAAAKARPKSADAALPVKERVKAALVSLEKRGSKSFREDMVARYGITTQDKTLGVSMAVIQKYAKELGRDHDFAAALWDSGVYEGRMLAIYVEEPEKLTPAQMDRWAKDCDNWAVCDTVCFKLFDQSPHAFAKIEQWAKRREEFVKRTAFALLASTALHGRGVEDGPYLNGLKLIEAAADDERNFVKKGVSWALRSIGGRKSPVTKAAALKLATKLAGSESASARFIGKEALRQFAKGRGK